MKVLFLTEGGREIGLGHITRCLGLSQALQRLGAETFFVVNGSVDIAARLPSSSQILPWSEPTHRESLNKLLMNFDVAVIDSYLADESVYQWISQRVSLMVSIDDNLRIEYPQGIVLNGTIDAEEFPYPKKKNQLRLLGATYTPLRPEFDQTADRKIPKEPGSILIFMGGSDFRNLTPILMREIGDKFPEFRKKVVVGEGFPSIEEIKKLSNPSFEVLFAANAIEMRAAMEDSDFAVTAAGQSLYELASLGVPAITIQVAENQSQNVASFLKKGTIKHAGNWNAPDLAKRVVGAIREMLPYSTRRDASLAGTIHVDGRGALRGAKTISEAWKLRGQGFRPVVWSDADTLLFWRNDLATVSASISQKKVPTLEHFSWLKQALADPFQALWIYQKGYQALGTVRFQLKSDYAEMSWTIAPEARNRGHGLCMVKMASEIFLKQNAKMIRAKVLSTNKSSLKIAKQAGFELISEGDGLTSWQIC